jgi:hypothetical protein
MRYFLDTEFSERGPKHPIELISIGIVAEDGREFYAVSSEFSISNCSPWVTENVLPHLGNYAPEPLHAIAHRLRSFVQEGEGKPEFWGYYADYDWVVLCQIFGAMIDLPKGFPMYCNDLKQASMLLCGIRFPKQTSVEHNALSDARWNMEAYTFLQRSPK